MMSRRWPRGGPLNSGSTTTNCSRSWVSMRTKSTASEPWAPFHPRSASRKVGDESSKKSWWFHAEIHDWPLVRFGSERRPGILAEPRRLGLEDDRHRAPEVSGRGNRWRRGRSHLLDQHG